MLPAVSASELAIQTDDERWLVRPVWGINAVGMIAGSAKSYKTWTGLELAFSVATGLPFLGRYPVEQQGRTLIYLAEDALPLVRARIDALCEHRKFDIQKLDVKVITAPVVRLDLADHQEKLRQTVAHFKPRLLLLDPLVRLHRLDENNATEMSGLLGYLRALQRSHDVAVVLVHHVSKRARPQQGQALRGTSDLHAWTDCAAYLAWRNKQLHLTLEHRSAKPPPPVVIDLVSGPDGDAAHLEVQGDVPEDDTPKQPSLVTRLLRIIQSSDKPINRTELRQQLKVNNEKLGALLTTLQERGRIRRTPQGWELTSRTPTPPPNPSPVTAAGQLPVPPLRDGNPGTGGRPEDPSPGTRSDVPRPVRLSSGERSP